MRLSIAIVSFNSQALLKQCLISVRDNIAYADGVEVFVVDNHSTDGSVTMVRESFPWVKLIVNDENRGFAAATNQAIVQALGDYLLLLNNDARLLPETAQSMMNFMAANPQVGIVGCKTFNADGSLQPSIYTFPRPLKDALSLWLGGTLLKHNQMLRTQLGWLAQKLGIQFYSAQDQTVSREVDYPQGACLMARRIAVDQVGLLDEGYFFAGEEMDWCYCMKQNGWKVYYYSEATVIHSGQGTSRQAIGKGLIQTRKSALYFYEKHYSWLSTESMKLLISLVLLARCVFVAAGLLFARSNRTKRLSQIETYWAIIRLHYDRQFRALNVFSEMSFQYI